jgi:hypothetical protein
MGVLTEQMEALTNGLMSAARSRAAAVAGVRHDTVRLLGQARTRLQEVGAARRAAGDRLTGELREAAGALAAKVGALLGDFDAAQGQRASDVNTFLARHKEARTGELNTLFGDLARAREEMARDFAVEIRGLVSRIQAGMEQFLGDARANRADSAEALRGRTAHALGAVHGRVAALLKETMDYLGRCERAHKAMSDRLHGMLSGNHKATHEQVSALLGGFRQARMNIAEDLRAAAELWDRVANCRLRTADSGSQAELTEPAARPPQPEAKAKRKTRKKTAAD